MSYVTFPTHVWYCDREPEGNCGDEGAFDISAVTKAECIKAAREDGWKITRTVTLCPAHAEGNKA